MTGQHLDPRALAGDPDNDDTILRTQGGVPYWGPVPGLGVNALVATVVGGVPLLVFDDDGSPVTTEVPE